MTSTYPPCKSGACVSRECCGQDMYPVEWPNLVGVAAEKAKAIITKDNPLVTVFTVPPGRGIFFDFCCNRVQLFIDENNRVRAVPMVG
ncbi:hypothetical protein ABFS82_12G052800 [Erythranthe guttata]|uniref:Uncharacterized protein n=1 Tax=Erythranthe guttata TaxID=4155 RepID=A0A022RE48_ERYGU|nr:hypothetical protein MIMGU_mgv1a026023mg [Erythranthe guttata]